ncbi:hypothetical protein BSKO_04871 [Bryopsis sp. KO-2023]|nr:hypothetical protein BSKO_04871 [Bryopsis sp. KO-2023]
MVFPVAKFLRRALRSGLVLQPRAAASLQAALGSGSSSTEGFQERNAAFGATYSTTSPVSNPSDHFPNFSPLWFRKEQGMPVRRMGNTPDVSADEIFDKAWEKIERKYGKDLVIPREIIFLNGAPGAGKGATTPFILKSRGLGRAISMSDVLALYPDSKKLMDRGDLIPDNIAIDALLAVIFDPASDDGVGLIVDGFPRTEFQVDLLKMLYERLISIHDAFAHTDRAHLYPRPSFKMVVLYVDEETSIRRQMGRGQKASVKNARAIDAGSHNVTPLRSTDISEAHAKKRYNTFKEHYGGILHLKDVFPFHLIDGMGSVDDSRRQIAKELRYQSSMDLNAETYAAIRHLPMAKELCRMVRQQLTRRLDSYMLNHRDVFHKVIALVEDAVLPILRRCGMAGEAVYHTYDELFTEQPLAIDVFVDVLTDRGFHVSYQQTEERTPMKIDLTTGEVHSDVAILHRFKMTFEVSCVRDTGGDVGLRSGHGAVSEGDTPNISMSFVPDQFDHQAKYMGPDARERLVAKMARGMPGADCETGEMEKDLEGNGSGNTDADRLGNNEREGGDPEQNSRHKNHVSKTRQHI